jgi:methionine biosynthesis protein MetW
VSDPAADYYANYWTDPVTWRSPETDVEVARLLRPLPLAESDVIDYGCGDGRRIGTWLSHAARSYVGVDVSEPAVEMAREQGLKAQVIAAERPLPFADGSFDLAVSSEVLEHLFEPQLALAELFRVLRPGGIVFVTVPNVAYWRRRLDLVLLGRWNPIGDALSVQAPWRDPHIRFFTTAALERLLTGAGFGEVVVSGHGGALLRDLPGLRKLRRRAEPSAIYACLERRAPGLLAGRLHARGLKAR